MSGNPNVGKPLKYTMLPKPSGFKQKQPHFRPSGSVCMHFILNSDVNSLAGRQCGIAQNRCRSPSSVPCMQPTHILLFFWLEALCPLHSIPAKADVNQAASVSHFTWLLEVRPESTHLMNLSSRTAVSIAYIMISGKGGKYQERTMFSSVSIKQLPVTPSPKPQSILMLAQKAVLCLPRT